MIPISVDHRRYESGWIGVAALCGDDDEDQAAAEDPVTEAKPSVNRAEIDRTILIFEQAAAALHAAHEVGIIHRDIKPGNLMVAKDGHPILLDFGLARDDSGDAGPSLTRTGDLFGTPTYMSPEQITGRRVKLDRRSDIYSLGVTLYECLTLKKPFEAPTRESLYQAIMSKEAQAARKINRQIPVDLEVVLQCAMDKDRDRRYQTAASFAEDLRRVRNGEPILAKKVSMLGRAWRWSERRPAAAALLTVLFLGIPTISGLGVWYWTHLDDVRAQELAKMHEAVEDELEIGFYELHHGEPKIAVSAFERGLALDAASAEAAVGLAYSYLKLRKPQISLQVLECAERAIATPEVLFPVKADVLRSLGRTALADALLSEAPTPSSALGWFIAGTRAMNKGHAVGEENPAGMAAFTAAEGHLARAVLASLHPRRAYFFELAHSQGHCKCEDATETADAVQALWPQSAVAWRWCGFATKDIVPQRAVAAFREAVRLKPEYAEAHYNLGRLLSDLGKLDEAIAEYREAIRLQPKYADAHRNLGLAFKKQGKLDEVIATYREAIRLNPEYADAHLTLGTALGQQGKLHEAAAACREAIQLNPEYPDAHFTLGTALSLQGKLDEAIAAFREAIRLNPDLVDAHYHLGITLGNQGKLDEAVAELRGVVRMKPEDARGHLDLGVALHQQGRLEEAASAYREAIRLQPKNADAHRNLGVAYLSQGKLSESVDAMRESVRLAPNHPRWINELAWMLVDPEGDSKLGNPKEALPLARKAVQLTGRKDVNILDTLAVALAANNELKEAVTVQEEILKLMNGKNVPGMTVADVEAALDRYKKALAAQSKDERPSR
jgi:tetratricopeptide (TPR) repeat protein